jgi:hypothetical protein
VTYWALHPVWDVLLHYVGPGRSFAPEAYAISCLSWNLVVAVYIAAAYGFGLIGGRRSGVRGEPAVAARRCSAGRATPAPGSRAASAPRSAPAHGLADELGAASGVEGSGPLCAGLSRRGPCPRPGCGRRLRDRAHGT